MIFCYITNPIVCLFCDENGELPPIFSLWQTWDDSCNPRFFVMEEVFDFLKYDYDRHYEEYKGTTPELEARGCTRWYARVKDPNFTIKERIQRYICRVLWLTRNCAYGFAFFWFGKSIDLTQCEEKLHKKDEKHYYLFGWDKSQNILYRTWWFKCDWWWTKRLYVDAYMGWKVEPERGIFFGMIANRCVPLKIKLHPKD
jgi:hypothetical protein